MANKHTKKTTANISKETVKCTVKIVRKRPNQYTFEQTGRVLYTEIIVNNDNIHLVKKLKFINVNQVIKVNEKKAMVNTKQNYNEMMDGNIDSN